LLAAVLNKGYHNRNIESAAKYTPYAFYTILTTNLYDKSQTKVGDYADRIYPIELEINDTTGTDRAPSNLDLPLEIDSEGRLRTKLHLGKHLYQVCLI
jgi:hypothetical protein